MPTQVLMCGSGTRLWCTRIGILILIFTTLMGMIVTFWNYYFTLMDDMDTMVQDSPKLDSILEICQQKIQYKWNIECEEKWMTREDASKIMAWQCITAPNTYIDFKGTGNIIHNSTSLYVTPHDACLKVMIWILPW